jgi:hypothetical protein
MLYVLKGFPKLYSWGDLLHLHSDGNGDDDDVDGGEGETRADSSNTFPPPIFT